MMITRKNEECRQSCPSAATDATGVTGASAAPREGNGVNPLPADMAEDYAVIAGIDRQLADAMRLKVLPDKTKMSDYLRAMRRQYAPRAATAANTEEDK